MSSVATMPEDDIAIADLTRAQKAAAVLLAVGPEVAGRVLQHLSPAEVEQVALEIATLGDVASERLHDVLVEFKTEALAHQQLISGGERHARELLRRVHGAQADEIVDRLLATVETAPFHFLRLHEPSVVVQHLRDEHPQTVALVVAHLPAKFAAAVIADLEPEVQGQVARRVAMLDGASPETVKRIEAALHDRLGLVQRKQTRQGGVRELAAVLNQADRGTERAILASLETSDPELAEQVRSLMFVFEDIVTLDDRAIQEVLRQVDTPKLALALKGVAAEVAEAVERNLSERARQSLAEEVEMLGPVRIRDVEQAQTDVVRTIRTLEENGTIMMNRGGDGEFIA